ncbi:hypothetical protein CPS_0792 [Colwellia psychrerythraea 34H]|uniref:Uncharacterized protein n=1 Tax=Colwellia psychrerythraea (strain 34H / ATCC BAA-681) TaxID=167879 RepID=Q488H4_COLP3|nr:hypothetical protein CPS_0792 [Colwellia psychrerythraea 34H]
MLLKLSLTSLHSNTQFEDDMISVSFLKSDLLWKINYIYTGINHSK